MMLRDYQEEAIQSIYDYFVGASGNPLIVAPTGAGKSVIIAKFVEGVVSRFPEQRILMLTHVKELVEQNFAKLMTVWPNAPAGINAASLKRRDTDPNIIFASVQSVYKRWQELGRFDLVLVDECHLIPNSGDGMYNTLLKGLRRFNPTLKVVGFTATPYRMKTGNLIGEGTLFTDIAYDIKIKTLIDRGYLCKVVPKHTKTALDFSNVKMRGGEYIAGQLEKAIDHADINQAAVNEIVEHGKDRKSWLIFCTGVGHAHHIAEEIHTHGVTAEVVTGETPIAERERIIADYKAGRVRALVNVNVLTTGFDAPETDLLACLRPTKSTGLWVQMIGRGMRPAEGKENCLVLDFAENTREHGPIDAVEIRAKKPQDEPGQAPVKICPECETYLHAAARECIECGHEFPPPEIKIKPKASTAQLLSFERSNDVYNITRLAISIHQKSGKPDSLRVDLYSGLRHICPDFLCLDHGGYATQKGVKRFKEYFGRAPAGDVRQIAGELGHTINVTLQVRTTQNGKYTNVISVEQRHAA